MNDSSSCFFPSCLFYFTLPYLWLLGLHLHYAIFTQPYSVLCEISADIEAFYVVIYIFDPTLSEPTPGEWPSNFEIGDIFLQMMFFQPLDTVKPS